MSLTLISIITTICINDTFGQPTLVWRRAVCGVPVQWRIVPISQQEPALLNNLLPCSCFQLCKKKTRTPSDHARVKLVLQSSLFCFAFLPLVPNGVLPLGFATEPFLVFAFSDLLLHLLCRNVFNFIVSCLGRPGSSEQTAGFHLVAKGDHWNMQPVGVELARPSWENFLIMVGGSGGLGPLGRVAHKHPQEIVLVADSSGPDTTLLRGTMLHLLVVLVRESSTFVCNNIFHSFINDDCPEFLSSSPV